MIEAPMEGTLIRPYHPGPAGGALPVYFIIFVTSHTDGSDKSCSLMEETSHTFLSLRLHRLTLERKLLL